MVESRVRVIDRLVCRVKNCFLVFFRKGLLSDVLDYVDFIRVDGLWLASLRF